MQKVRGGNKRLALPRARAAQTMRPLLKGAAGRHSIFPAYLIHLPSFARSLSLVSHSLTHPSSATLLGWMWLCFRSLLRGYTHPSVCRCAHCLSGSVCVCVAMHVGDWGYRILNSRLWLVQCMQTTWLLFNNEDCFFFFNLLIEKKLSFEFARLVSFEQRSATDLLHFKTLFNGPVTEIQQQLKRRRHTMAHGPNLPHGVITTGHKAKSLLELACRSHTAHILLIIIIIHFISIALYIFNSTTNPTILYWYCWCSNQDKRFISRYSYYFTGLLLLLLLLG